MQKKNKEENKINYFSTILNIITTGMICGLAGFGLYTLMDKTITNYFLSYFAIGLLGFILNIKK